VAAAAVTGLLVLDPAADRVQRPVRQGDHVEGVDHLGCLGQDHRVDRRVGVRHVQRAEGDPRLPVIGLFVEESRDVSIVPGRQDVDDLVVLDVGDRGRVVGLGVPAEPDEAGLVQPDRRPQELALSRERRARPCPL
jgi:hypothetical protein